ncbi:MULTISPECIES: helicase HerA-like domain-containing protein [unclassified Streptomyces]|uniref:helicase HerA-like domain-containing protein n=1 Tax=unclassified Streptomyces TaxID=2593676 RepID=UPI0016611BA0|nr:MULTISPECIES: helicase HerA-like domain-containing protein [unclassified Streptomyces]MBD0709296.1 ATP-binding protein [Streptomyces sp. CBMA291]MBD0712614.1 ATP-binding protein [Streptomyces sp. CBMA370]
MSASEQPPEVPVGPAAEIAAGYAFEGAALELGALLWDGVCHPDAPIRIPLAVLNRHGLVAGATGTGKTKTLQLIAEQLSAHGVPVFLADVKGDLSGISAPGAESGKARERAGQVGQEWRATGFPAEFYGLGGTGPGIPVRATVTGFGPVLLAKVLQLNPTQEQSLGLIFHYADAKGLELVDLKDLRAVAAFLVSDVGKPELKGIGGLSTATAGVILRSLTAFEQQGAGEFFGEPEFDTGELLRTARDGRGIVSVLELPAVQDKPQLFSTFLMWLLADLYHDLPEVGDLDQPKLVFFFDEAHLLFKGASKAFLESITQTVRLIRSKGVGVFFVTQTPRDVPADVLGQLGNRVQHALRAFTPDDAKALKATVRTFPNSPYDLEEVLTGLGTGEAVVTVLSERGAPTPVAATRLRAPESLMGPVDPAALDAAVKGSPLYGRYAQAVDRESAYEKLTEGERETAGSAPASGPGAASGSPYGSGSGAPSGPVPDPPYGSGRTKARAPEEEPSLVEQVVGSGMFKSLARSVGTQLGREISRSLFGTARRRR